MSRRSLAVLSLALVTLSLAACSDPTAPAAASQRQIKPAAASADLCTGGTLTSSGKC